MIDSIEILKSSSRRSKRKYSFSTNKPEPTWYFYFLNKLPIYNKGDIYYQRIIQQEKKLNYLRHRFIISYTKLWQWCKKIYSNKNSKQYFKAIFFKKIFFRDFINRCFFSFNHNFVPNTTCNILIQQTNDVNSSIGRINLCIALNAQKLEIDRGNDFNNFFNLTIGN